MRIFLLTHYYAPEIGAPQRRWRELVTGMIAAGHQVAVCAPVPHYPYRSASDVGGTDEKTMVWADGPHGERLLRLPYLPTSGSMAGQLIDQSWSSLFAVRVAAAMRTAKPDVVISTTPGLPMLFTGDIVARMLGVPHIAEIRDAWPDLIADSSLVRTATRGLLPATLTDYAEATAIPAAFHSVMRRAAHIVVTSDVFASRLKAAGHTEVTVVRNTAVPFRPTAQHRKRDASSPLRLLYVGTVGRSQGLESLARAVTELGGIELTIAGAGAAHRSLQQWAESSWSTSCGRSDGPAIRVLPQTTGAELGHLWTWADSGVVSLRGLPSFEYTVPSKLYTLMARGIHITGILAGEAAGIVTDAQAGHVVAPGDESGLRELLTAMRDGRVDLTPSERAQEWLAQHAAPDVALSRYLSILEGAR
ncbi:putative glycosyl transferase [Brevibacterium ravenspurgense]|uniref:D-inositol 3-phosphate glycosyltransferase n=1 Tax=Brevibacterium ravenspurgense TaxID=479117 RepID=A0A150H5A6_9MICO|nr:glycosyltransferase family 4 protein [Brevibacterium ravenspurgense]KXZ57309.1 putative glycosyl transferase [Brevibacterium ravenspurgense]